MVTTMHQKDLQIYDQMNIQTDAIIANQADCFFYQEVKNGDNTVRLLTTPTRGVSRNRNIALAVSTADYVLFADDDLIFRDGYEEMIFREFRCHPEAEAIKFNLHNLSEKRKISMGRIEKFEKATRRNMSASGVCGVVVKREALVRKSLYFHEFFGPGTDNYCGEDTIFLQSMLNRKVKLYRSPLDIAGIDQTESTWFEGYNEKYFTVTGRVLGTIYPFLSYLTAVRSAFRFTKREKCKMKFWQILKCYYRGIMEASGKLYEKYKRFGTGRQRKRL